MGKAPLSTMRVLTASCAGIPEGSEWRRGRDEITPLTVVFRAGRAGAQTDHSAIFYNVDMDSGKITRGGNNAHWYEVGLGKVTSQKKNGAWTKNGVFRGEGFKRRREAQGVHPDTGVDLVGKQVPQIQASLELCKRAHKELCASAPLCWLGRGSRRRGERAGQGSTSGSLAPRSQFELQLLFR